MSPIVGHRWKKKDTDYDLCDVEFQKLTTNQQALFENSIHTSNPYYDMISGDRFSVAPAQTC